MATPRPARHNGAGRHRGRGGVPPPRGPAKHGITRRVGIAGVDLVRSWRWTSENRAHGCDCGWTLPIDRYRVRRAPGMAMLDKALADSAPHAPELPMHMFDYEEA